MLSANICLQLHIYDAGTTLYKMQRDGLVTMVPHMKKSQCTSMI